MGKVYFNEDLKKVLDKMILANPLVQPGKMFGYPAYFVHKKLFACVYEDAVGIKVPFDYANQKLSEDGITHFIPMGRRKMKEWIQINRNQANDYFNDKDVFDVSLNYVLSLTER